LSPTITGAIIIVVVLVLTGAYFLTQSGTGSTTSQQTSSGTSTSTTTNGTPNPVAKSWQLAEGYEVNLKDLFGNYSQMAFTIRTVGLNYSEYANQTYSFAVVGHPILDGVSTIEVVSNSTLVAVSNGTVETRTTDNNVVWMASNGTLVQTDENGTSRTGTRIGEPNQLITPFVLGGPFTYAVDLLSMNSTLVDPVSTTTVDVGSTPMSATIWGQTTTLADTFGLYGIGFSFTVETGLAQGATFYVPISTILVGPPSLNGFQSEVTQTTVTLVSITPA
jgi:hypothetical protein